MEEKICLFSRVSTNIQDLTSQENALIKAAIADGYKEDQFIIISEHESGVKNSIKDRIGITKAIDAVLNENVRTIYCYELSRVARRLDVFYEFRSFLVEHKVQLIILQPSVKLLNDKGEIDENFSLVFSIFASLAEQEARLIKSRMMRGKNEKRANNKFCDGYPAYAYRRDKEGVLSINEEEAEIVRHIYYEYNSGKIVEEIAKELIANGVLENRNFSQAKNFCYHILHNCIYCGRPTTSNTYFNVNVKHGYVYPAIISEAEFDKADATFKKRAKYNKTKSKYVWLCRGILVNEEGEPYHVHIGNNYYYTLLQKFDYLKTRTIPRKLIDDFIWEMVVKYVLAKPGMSIDERKKELEKKLKEVEMLISDSQLQLLETDAKIKKIEYRIINGKLNEDLGDEMKAKFIKEKDDIKKELCDLEARRDTLNEKMINLSSNGLDVTRSELDQYSDEDKAALIKKEINNITAVKKDVGKVMLGIQFNICDDPEIVELEYREYKKRPKVNA